MRVFVNIALLTCFFVLSGCGTYDYEESSMDEVMIANKKRSGDDPLVELYKLRPLDQVRINLSGIPTEKLLNIVIDEHGHLTIPLIDDPIFVVGLTTTELERKIKEIYIENKIYKDVTVNVMMHGKYYYMEGEFRTTKQFQLSQRTTLLQAIAIAGGCSSYADKTKLTIVRGTEILRFNLEKIEENPELDIIIKPGDRIKLGGKMW